MITAALVLAAVALTVWTVIGAFAADMAVEGKDTKVAVLAYALSAVSALTVGALVSVVWTINK
jgi:hypothetical protein